MKVAIDNSLTKTEIFSEKVQYKIPLYSPFLFHILGKGTEEVFMKLG